ncbi:MAG TPA: hypothetical protein VGY55_09125 [Pirellulales bacterium]|jgi:hypothetical protein|nr:hypothetical protein [Pirellulales bacterium]
MKRAKKRFSRQLHLEALEGRLLLSASTNHKGLLQTGLTALFSTARAHAMVSHANVTQQPVIPNLTATPTLTVSTIPANGDLNPYGVAFVPDQFPSGGRIHADDILVSNFNNSGNVQGTGTTIIDVSPSGKQSLFFQGPTGLGLTTALGVLKRGFVIVGSVPTTDGTGATAQQGSLTILDKNGLQVATFSNAAILDGPWDLTIHDEGSRAQVFVANVLSGAVERLDLSVPAHGNDIVVESAVQIASGYTHRTDPAALLLGPTGLAYDAKTDTLFVASTADNEVFAIHHAGTTKQDQGTGTVFINDTTHLHGPLGLALAPNGDLLVANGDAVNADPAQPSEIVEYTSKGKFVAQISLDTNPDAAFGIAISSDDGQLRFAAVEDDTNSLDVWTISKH